MHAEDNNDSSLARCSGVSATHEQNQPASACAESSTSRPRKAKQHRKRHVMPGPAGLLFQQSQTHMLNFSSKRSKSSFDPLNVDSPPPSQDEEDDLASNTKPIDFDLGCNAVAGVSFYSPAWMVMQIELGFRTPSLQAYLSNEQKYKILRPCYPTASHYLVPDVLSGKADWNISPRSLLVLVQNNKALTDNLWTVTLIDETCVTMEAWIQPFFVKREQQRSYSHQTMIRPGLVWLVQDATIMLMANKDRKKKTQRMLLIKQENIQQVWSPSMADDVGETAYREWVESRNSLTVQATKLFNETMFQEDERRVCDQTAAAAFDGPAALQNGPQLKTNIQLPTDAVLPSLALLQPSHRPIIEASDHVAATNVEQQQQRAAVDNGKAAAGLPTRKGFAQPFARSMAMPVDTVNQAVAIEPSHVNLVAPSSSATVYLDGEVNITRHWPNSRQSPRPKLGATANNGLVKHSVMNQQHNAPLRTGCASYTYSQLRGTSTSNLLLGHALKAGTDAAAELKLTPTLTSHAASSNVISTVSGLWNMTDAELDMLDESDQETCTEKDLDIGRVSASTATRVFATKGNGQAISSLFQPGVDAGFDLDGFNDEDE
ncbi:hypothetical protein MPSEU_000364100 [Mayamaea pseudoterrestris]|nr:hypothetical protein MPSEU_000364100 [Mayamaea pseudoterrestris]